MIGSGILVKIQKETISKLTQPHARGCKPRTGLFASHVSLMWLGSFEFNFFILHTRGSDLRVEAKEKRYSPRQEAKLRRRWVHSQFLYDTRSPTKLTFDANCGSYIRIPQDKHGSQASVSETKCGP